MSDGNAGISGLPWKFANDPTQECWGPPQQVCSQSPLLRRSHPVTSPPGPVGIRPRRLPSWLGGSVLGREQSRVGCDPNHGQIGTVPVSVTGGSLYKKKNGHLVKEDRVWGGPETVTRENQSLNSFIFIFSFLCLERFRNLTDVGRPTSVVRGPDLLGARELTQSHEEGQGESVPRVPPALPRPRIRALRRLTFRVSNGSRLTEPLTTLLTPTGV